MFRISQQFEAGSTRAKALMRCDDHSVLFLNESFNVASSHISVVQATSTTGPHCVPGTNLSFSEYEGTVSATISESRFPKPTSIDMKHFDGRAGTRIKRCD